MSIHIGLAGWGDHDQLYTSVAKAGSKLRQYAKHFPLVEVDSTFYAIQSKERFIKWLEDTPATLHFVVKAYQGMTGHQRGPSVPAAETNEMFASFRTMLEPVMETGRLSAALFQYPPWFDCTQANVRILRETKARMSGFPCALEFRHQSWFTEEYKEKTLSFMKREQWIHSVCDEPQAGIGSIPEVLEATDSEMTVVRFHGRNISGWNQASAPNWREVRYLYRYSDEELLDWAEKLRLLEQQSKQVNVIFNNNSGGDAAANAKRLMELLGLTRPDGSSPNEPPPPVVEQLDLF
ncbi:uncharacterized protein YecE (DUF72 family) [Paenibacillus endophyticus]|uniref:Uncharacterized protein YecE (DUF72 family) n=1 Tax=Paenibacillus endophyticus TaxID=1294268 RepID=A0A7W5CFC6_9BACL|nr:DUF72 domain-containing protein [Paenibacillus endophyticus]MBB3156194.1 uncharacterized protein YecE (DUF72 family) [Paenibacillus endophyticus]